MTGCATVPGLPGQGPSQGLYFDPANWTDASGLLTHGAAAEAALDVLRRMASLSHPLSGEDCGLVNQRFWQGGQQACAVTIDWDVASVIYHQKRCGVVAGGRGGEEQ